MQVYGNGFIVKFMQARARGASHEELTQLKWATQKEMRQRSPDPRPDASRSLASDVVDIGHARRDRARLEAEWQSALD